MSEERANDTVTDHEVEEALAAYATDKEPIVFVHGLWLLPRSWGAGALPLVSRFV